MRSDRTWPAETSIWHLSCPRQEAHDLAKASGRGDLDLAPELPTGDIDRNHKEDLR